MTIKIAKYNPKIRKDKTGEGKRNALPNNGLSVDCKPYTKGI